MSRGLPDSPELQGGWPGGDEKSLGGLFSTGNGPELQDGQKQEPGQFYSKEDTVSRSP